MKLHAVPLSKAEANELVRKWHRHSNPVAFHRFAIGAAYGKKIVGCAIVGNPKARGLQNGWTAEVVRCVTDGTPNACSFLYASAWKAARAMGYRRLITYTLQSESGSSLKAVGWKIVGEVSARSWHTPTRPRVDKHELQMRFRWEVNEHDELSGT